MEGDEIIVTSGTYYENIEFGGKNIILRSTDPLDEDVVTSTVIDGQGLLPVVIFSGDEGTTSVVSGFTIRNGLGIMYLFDLGSEIVVEYWGGGIYGNSTQAQIDHCHIRENQAHTGMSVYYAGSVLHNVIEDNINLPDTGSVSFGSASDIRACVGEIAYNRIENDRQGKGISNSAYYIHHNYITRCEVGIGGFGVVERNIVIDNDSIGISGIEDYQEISGIITGNIIWDCTYRGIWSSDAPIYNNIICFNNLNGDSFYGGGIDGCDGLISHNLVAFNYASLLGGGIFDCQGEITNNILWGNIADLNGSQITGTTTPTYCLIEGTTLGDDTNSTATPLFADAWALDFRLLPGSPGIDHGTSAGLTLDFLSNARPQDGDGLGAGSTGDGLDFDIGPYEAATDYRVDAIRSYILGQTTTTDSLLGSPWPAEWPEEWIAELQAIELPTTAVAMLTSYTLQTGGVTTTSTLDINADGRLDAADIVLAVTTRSSSSSPSSEKKPSSVISRTASSANQSYITRWHPPALKPMPERRPFPIEPYRERYGKYAEAIWKLENTKHPGKGPIIVDLREYENQ
ncbi:hypothetical protein JXA32_12770 [Candidatus Sumerlaeota bacterium]|nr:hypothetical protein [Candidatus Sumerlaeota bacterium]